MANSAEIPNSFVYVQSSADVDSRIARSARWQLGPRQLNFDVTPADKLDERGIKNLYPEPLVIGAYFNFTKPRKQIESRSEAALQSALSAGKQALAIYLRQSGNTKLMKGALATRFDDQITLVQLNSFNTLQLDRLFAGIADWMHRLQA
jgi:hypothetical protein